MKWKLKTKMFVYILATTLLIYTLAIGYISISFKNRATNDAMLVADSYAHEAANFVKARLNEHFGIARALAQSFQGYEKIPPEQRKEIYSDMIRNILVENPEYIAVFEQWEISAIDPAYKKPYGRIRSTFYREGKKIIQKIDTLDLEGDNLVGIYYRVKSTHKEYITRPYYYSYELDQALPQDIPDIENAVLEATIIIPILKNGKFVGMTGMDVPLENFQDIVEEINPLKGSYTFLVANNGHFVAHPNKKLINQSIAKLNPDENAKFKFEAKIRTGEKFSFLTRRTKFGKKTYVSFAPLSIGRTNSPWSVGIVVPMNLIMEEANKTFFISITVGLIGLIILTIILWFISHNITLPLKDTTLLLKNLARGNIQESNRLVIRSRDEIGEMTRSANILLDESNRTTNFARQIGEGNLNADYALLGEQDELGNALIEMRNRLKKSTEEITKQRDDLKELNAAKDRFFSIIAHDLKNPFSVLLSVTEVLIESYKDLSDEEKNLSIRRINKSANQLFNLLENLLQWSMSQTGSIKYVPEKMDMGIAVASNVSLLKMNAESKNVKLTSEIKEETYVYADVDMIRTVVRNLLSNAIKFNKTGGDAEVISKKKNDFLEVSVIDSGIGLNKEDLGKLFRIDVQNKSIGTSKEKGTGLGLILSKEYIEKNGGEIWVESELGKGSKFTFTLPVS
ncbi:MAG: HAMP domain-containing protein [Bacteroidetes bacterium]|nr:HAMP domain-containing protein [Bacteroidota bacterium]